jgi:predicted MFS family arabinose efflux permease
MWTGAFISTSGTWMQTVAQAWLVYQLSDSALYLGTDAFLATVPMIIFSLLGGVIADRIERRKILLASQYAQMTIAFVLAALIYSKQIQIWHIFILSFLTGSVQAFGGPAYQALLPLIVRKDQVPNAIAMNSLQFNLARMIGPVLAGLAFSARGAAFCFFLNGLSFLPVILSLLMLRVRVLPQKSNRSIGHEMKEGVRFVLRDRPIAQLTIVATVCTFLGMPLITLLPVVAREVFRLGAGGYGWMLTASGAGSVTGALLVAGLGHAKRKGRAALLCQLAFSICLLVFAYSSNYWLSLVCLYVGGASLLGVITTVSSLVQLTTAEEMRGRVMSIFMMAFRGGMPLGSLVAGWVAEVRSVQFALGLNAILLFLAAGTLLTSRSAVKEL